MINRLEFFRISSAMTFSFTPLALYSSRNENNNGKYHEPPTGVNYSTNPSVFGRILNGDLPCKTYDESTTDLLAFQDKSPRAKLHALVIPKRHIPTITDLTPNDVALVQDMKVMGLSLIEKYEHDAFMNGDYITCFHVPPFNSVDHLHLHVLAPASEMNWVYRVKYLRGMRWCVSDEVVIERLERGLSAAPFLF
jgi:diadenosine tetraphosphate (Ap4A) HIT family hydrolase